MTTTTTAPVAVSEHAPTRSPQAADPDRVDLGSVRVVHTRHWFRWILSAIVVFVILQFLWSLATNPQWQWDVFAEYFFAPSVINGLWLTLALTVVSGAVGLRARRRARGVPAVEVAAAERRGVVVHLVLPVGAARRADPRLVQPRIPVPDARTRHAVHHGLLARRVPDDDDDLGVRRGDHRPLAAPGRVLGRDHPGRHPLGRPGPARGGRRARPAPPHPLLPHHAAAGRAGHRAERVQRDHRAREGHLGGVHRRAARAVLHGAGHLQPQPARHPAAARGGRLVRAHHDRALDRAVLRRAALRPRRAPRAAAHARPACRALGARPSGDASATPAADRRPPACRRRCARHRPAPEVPA